MLPRRIPKERKRASRWRSQAHCNFVREHECCVPACILRPIEVAHVRIGSGAGIGQKPDDWNTVSLCKEHHAQQHAIGERSFWTAHGVDPERMVTAFIQASPKRAEIEQVRKERANG